MTIRPHTRSFPVSLDGVLTCIAILYTTIYLVLSRIASVLSAFLATTVNSIGFDRIVRRYSAAMTAALLGGAGIVALQWFPRDWPGFSMSIALFLPLLSVAIAGTRRVLELPHGIRELRVPQSTFERLVARKLANPLDAIFVRLTIGTSAVVLPSFVAVLVPGTCSPYAMVLYVLMMISCAETFELVDHTNMHNRVFNPNRTCGLVSRIALRNIALWHEYGLALAMARIPHRYRIQHIYVHHVENNGPDDPQTTFPYNRTSYFAFSRFALKMGVNSTFPWDLSSYLLRARRYRVLAVLHANLLIYAAFIVALGVFNLPAAILILSLRLSFGIGATLLNFYEHGLIDPSEPQNLYRNAATIAILHEDDHGSLGSDFHVAHHAHPSRHWSQLIADARASVDLYRDADTIVFKDARAIVSNLLRRRFDALAAHCELNGRSPSALAQELQRRAGSHAERRHTVARRLDEWLGEFAGRFLITA